jgi:hypothetical protein
MWKEKAAAQDIVAQQAQLFRLVNGVLEASFDITYSPRM